MPDFLTSSQTEAIHALIDKVSERQRQDFGNLSTDVKPDGTLITACDRWSDQAFVDGFSMGNQHFSSKLVD